MPALISIATIGEVASAPVAAASSIPLLGEAAGLGTAMCWVGTSFCFAAASRRLGAGTVNLVRSVLALGPLLALNLLILGGAWPNASWEAIGWLALSGVVGLALGDQFLFVALVDLGPRLAVLLMTLAPVFAAIAGLVMLSERIAAPALLGMAITLGGIAWVVAERPAPGDARAAITPPRVRARGLALGVLAAAAQGVGVVIAKQGMIGSDTPVEPLAAQLVRMSGGVTALALAWSILGPRRWLAGLDLRAGEARVTRPAVLGLIGGTLLGPVLGVWMSLVAVRALDAGVASTLMSLSPVLVLPIARIVDRERIGWRAAVGAGVAVGGVVLLAASNRDAPAEAAIPDLPAIELEVPSENPAREPNPT
jgi:drug/metabolite transporter (DMT)-like permease